MPTLDELRSNRNALFWALHSAGWIAYAVTQHFGALLYAKPPGYHAVIAIAAVAGFLLSLPFRYLYRRLWGRSPQVIVLGALAACYIVALALRMVINIVYQQLVEPTWVMRTGFEIFGGALSSAYLLLCWTGLYFGFKYYESLQVQREAALKAATLAQEAQLKMLRYQLNPHFLFNTLNAISTLILENETQKANHAVARLSEFLRYTLDQDPMNKVTLRQEVDALNLYLNTERLRFGSRLRLEFVIEAPAFDALVPSLLLQPLIENAIKYSVAPREDGGAIRIEGRARGPMLEMSVIDDGPGVNSAAQILEGRGVGIRNTRERLAVLYGERHRFAILNANPGLRIEMGFRFERNAAA